MTPVVLVLVLLLDAGAPETERVRAPRAKRVVEIMWTMLKSFGIIPDA